MAADIRATSGALARRDHAFGLALYLAKIVLVAIAYWAAARVSLDLALVRGQVTPIWPPTGIALVTFLILGNRMWPAIALGAFAVNLPLGPSPAGAALIAGGNTLAPLAAAQLLHRAGFRYRLDRLRDAIAIVVLGALIGMTISATVGTAVLTIFGAVPMSSFASTWAVWWAGDAMGVLLVAPALLSVIRRPRVRRLGLRRSAELVGLLGAVGLATYLLLENPLRLEYLVLPLIALVAWRFRLAGAAPAALIASAISGRSLARSRSTRARSPRLKSSRSPYTLIQWRASSQCVVSMFSPSSAGEGGGVGFVSHGRPIVVMDVAALKQVHRSAREPPVTALITLRSSFIRVGHHVLRNFLRRRSTIDRNRITRCY
ncbi:MAG TPA: MASE1 domain-containing protein [Candidatus Limnocylindrales bacterium]|nr:MASE1 domain-containing protein [Candidatus Limnocylindrales bacterium]